MKNLVRNAAIVDPPRAIGSGLLAGCLAMLLTPFCLRAEAPAAAEDAAPAAPVEVTMTTTEGSIELELYPARAPATVANFLRYVDGGRLDGGAFYRTVRLDNQTPAEIPIQVIQGGVFGGGLGGMDDGKRPEPFPPVVHETTAQTGLRHEAGALSMARAEPGTATSEFFIAVVESPELDAGGKRNPDGQGFAVFGRVVDGMDVVKRIHAASAAESRGRTDLGVMRGQLLDRPVRICSVARRTPGAAPAAAAADCANDTH